MKIKFNRKVSFNINFKKAGATSNKKKLTAYKINNKVNFGKIPGQLPTLKRRSLFESEVDKGLKKNNISYDYESMIIPWHDLDNNLHSYHPDYTVKLKRNKLLFLEAKGLFDIGMLIKYSRMLDEHSELRKYFIIVFQNGNNILNMSRINMYDTNSPKPTRKQLSYLGLSKKGKFTYNEVCNKLNILNIEISELGPYILKNYKIN